jgi:phospholipid/cholesterol/gamma-HCH transport system substrate-binding protein
MKQQTKLELVVGVFVFAGILAVSWLALRIGAGAVVAGDTYTVTAEFANTGTLNPGSNVVIAGVPIGRVETVVLDEKRFRAVVTLRLPKAVQLPLDTIASIRTAGLIGDKFVGLAPGGDPDLIAADGTGRITEHEDDVDIASLISRFAFGSVQQNPDEKK